ncbi:MAG: 4-hydroxythreonine-4-phosphate dehydrogenase PdxA [Candidatus Omnitrophica bacterium]|nr:4-hydroxythreonine-4-phosphate dehydrogenase PdxA [Candidatus Omnitrophota bacterium]
MLKRLVITMGDPAGIGPFILVKSLLPLRLKNVEVVLLGDRKVLSGVPGFKRLEGRVTLVDLKNAGGIPRGQPGRGSGIAALEYLYRARDFLGDQKRSCLVTGPVSKEAIQLSKTDFTGHTEFLAKEFSVENFAMMMVGRILKIVFLTRHVNIRDVPKQLNLTKIKDTLKLTSDSLRFLFGLRTPKIALCSLNPHAGLDTYLEREEKNLLKAVKDLKEKNTDFIGPYPADTLFKEALKGGFDAVVSFYHDQGMIPFKSFEFSSGVNLTLGLPFVRTSPAHGPAFNIVNKSNKIDPRSMTQAIKLALKLKSNPVFSP